MDRNEHAGVTPEHGLGTWPGALGPTLLVGLSVVGYAAGVAPKLLGISWVAFGAMAGAIPLGRRAGRQGHARGLVWGYGLASGAMITSAAVFLLPVAVDHHAAFGGFGVAAGIVLGFSAHAIGHRLSHAGSSFEDTALRLTAHALAAGAVIGVVYGAMPDLGPLLGLAIVSHKGPAGYAAARRLAGQDRSASSLLVPAAGVGIAAIPAAMLSLSLADPGRGLLFGFAAGVFLHVAMDFLPRCEVGGEIYEAAATGEDSHARLDRLRLHSVASTILGGVAVFVAWLVVAGG
ncbi:MAG: ZIP family metal transporter [Halobacteriales archaeon]